MGRFYPYDPKPEDVNIEDIALALSHQCRFTGHTKWHYSVAQHSILVSRLFTDKRVALTALLHDASEAYLADIARPVKEHPAFAFYYEIEHRVMAAIAARFDFDWPLPEPIIHADNVMLHTEAAELFPTVPEWVNLRLVDRKIRIHRHTPGEAKRDFLKRFAELSK